MSKQLVKGTAMLTAASLTGIALNFLFYTIGKVIGPESFGILVSLISLSYVVNLLQSVVSNLVIKVVASRKLSMDVFFAQTDPLMLKIQFGLGVIMLLVSVIFLQRFLKIDSIWPFVGLVLILSTSLLNAVRRGALGGKKRFAALGISQVAEAVFKVAGAFVAAWLGFGVTGIMFAIALSNILAFIVLLLLTRNLGDGEEVKLQALFGKKLLAAMSAGTLFLNLMFIVDSLIARNSLDAVNAGFYAAIISYGKVIFFMASSVGQALFPLSLEQASSLKLLLEAAAITIGLGIASMIGFALLGDFVTRILFGTDFLPVVGYLPFEALIMTLYVLFYQTAVYLLGHDRHAFSMVLVGGFVLQVIVLLLNGSSIAGMLNGQLIVMLLLCIVTAVYLLATRRHYES